MFNARCESIEAQIGVLDEQAADRLDLSKVAQLIRCVVQLWTLWMLEPIDCARERSSWETE